MTMMTKHQINHVTKMWKSAGELLPTRFLINRSPLKLCFQFKPFDFWETASSSGGTVFSSQERLVVLLISFNPFFTVCITPRSIYWHLLFWMGGGPFLLSSHPKQKEANIYNGVQSNMNWIDRMLINVDIYLLCIVIPYHRRAMCNLLSNLSEVTRYSLTTFSSTATYNTRSPAGTGFRD